MYEAGGRIVHGKLSRQESEVSQCLRRCRMEQPVTSTAADYRLPAPQFMGRKTMLEINGLTGNDRSTIDKPTMDRRVCHFDCRTLTTSCAARHRRASLELTGTPRIN